MPALWGVSQRAADLLRVPDYVTHGEAALRDYRLERLPGNIFHRDEENALCVIYVVAGDNAGVIQCRDRLRLLHEPATAVLIGRLVGRKDLEGHIPVQAGVASLVDHAHAAFPESLDDLKMR